MRSSAARSLAVATFGLLVACSTATPPNAMAGGAKTPPPAGGASSAVSGEAPSAKPAGKISPQMVGKLSPIPAFIGQGKGWRIKINALDATQHRVVLEWTSPPRTDSGTALYRGALKVARGTPLALDGRLQTREGDKTLRIEIRTEACTDDQGVARPQRIVLAFEGNTTLNGCGDLAMY